MAMLWLVIQREFVSNVLTSRFMIGFIVCVLSTAVAVFVPGGRLREAFVGVQYCCPGSGDGSAGMGSLC